MIPSERIATVAAAFSFDGDLVQASPHRGGHIHESHLLTFRVVGGRRRYLLQRVNTSVFPDPERVMSNISRVTEHIAGRLRAEGVRDLERRILSVVATCEGRPLHRDPEGSVWRAFRFIESVRVELTARSPAFAETVARAFGRFQELVRDLPPPRLHETIPGFHDTPSRFDALHAALVDDTRNRAAIARREVESILSREAAVRARAERLKDAAIPERVVHNDTKPSNVLLDAETGEPLCVVDLDTVMPGLALDDFGDMVRSMASPAAEDERDPSRVAVDPALFEGLARGYLGAAGAFLTAAERAELVASGESITLEQAARFLTDFLQGDVYYRTDRPAHNLERTRAQLALLASLEHYRDRLEEIVADGRTPS